MPAAPPRLPGVLRGVLARLRSALSTRRGLLAGVAGAVLASRALAYGLLGLRFYDRELDRYMPFLDVELLRTDLLRSVWHLHLKPPVMNLGAGAMLQGLGEASTAGFAAAYAALGAALAASLTDLLRQVGVPPAGAGLLGVGFALAPPALLFETFLLHTYPAAALVTAAAACFGRALASGRGRWWAAAFGLAGLLCLTRSLYHLAWLLAVIGLALALRWGERRRLLRAAALPAGATVALYAKNLLLFGFFGATSWLGISLAKGTVDRLPAATRSAWVEQGILSPVAQVDPFAGPGAYLPHVDAPPPAGVPALDRRRKASGAPNYNHRVFPAASRAQLRNALAVLRRRPARFLKGTWRDLQHWLSPATTWHPRGASGSPFRLNRHRVPALRAYEQSFNRLLHAPLGGDRVGVFALVPLLLVAGAWQGVRAVRRGDRARGGVQLLLVGTVAYAGLVSCLVETGPELSRFRFTVDALLLALAASLAVDLARAAGPRAASGPAPTPRRRPRQP
jgi:hypothetical protein